LSERPLIFIDFDGVICDSLFLRLEWLEKKGYGDFSNILTTGSEIRHFLGREVHDLIKTEVGYSDTLKAREIDGVREALKKLVGVYDLQILSARHSSKLTWISRWLHKNSMDSYFSKIVSSFDKRKLEICDAERAFAIVDNDIGNLCDPKLKDTTRVLLSDRTENLPLYIKAFDEWPKIVRFLM